MLPLFSYPSLFSLIHFLLDFISLTSFLFIVPVLAFESIFRMMML